MRRLLYISLALMLVTMAMGCGRSVDERLVLADSLMWTAPDSSLAILNAIDRDSLGDDENLAYTPCCSHRHNSAATSHSLATR